MAGGGVRRFNPAMLRPYPVFVKETPGGHASRWAEHRLQSELPKPGIGAGRCDSFATSWHSSPSGTIHAPGMRARQVIWSMCHRIDFRLRICLESRALSPPGPFADPQ
jgi:hypothetical protein